MDVTVVDRAATSGDSRLHCASPASKLVGTALVVAAVVVSDDPLLLAGVAFGMTGAAAALRLPVRSMAPFALYPTLFALIFAFASATGPVTAATIVLKAITAALALVILIFTTPYPQVFAPIQRVLPVVVGDALLLTYRSLFILADKYADLTRAIRLRSGISARQPLRSAQAAARALGGLLLYSLDLARRDYDVLRLRGYEGGLRVTPVRGDSPVTAVAIVAVTGMTTTLALLFRTLPIGGYSWIVTVAGLLILLGGPLFGRRR